MLAMWLETALFTQLTNSSSAFDGVPSLLAPVSSIELVNSYQIRKVTMTYEAPDVMTITHIWTAEHKSPSLAARFRQDQFIQDSFAKKANFSVFSGQNGIEDISIRVLKLKYAQMLAVL